MANTTPTVSSTIMMQHRYFFWVLPVRLLAITSSF